MRTRARAMGFGAVLVLVAGALAGACESSGSGATCFPPEHGPSDPSCAGFTVGLICPVGVSPWYSCVCTATGSTQTWVCSASGASGGSGGGGGGGGGGSGGDAGSGGSTADAGSD